MKNVSKIFSALTDFSFSRFGIMIFGGPYGQVRRCPTKKVAETVDLWAAYYQYKLKPVNKSACIPWRGQFSDYEQPLMLIDGDWADARYVIFRLYNSDIQFGAEDYMLSGCGNHSCVNPTHVRHMKMPPLWD